MRWLLGDVVTSPYAALTGVAARARTGSAGQALPGLARALAQGTDAQRAEVWLAVADRLVSTASYPPGSPAQPRAVASVAMLLALPNMSPRPTPTTSGWPRRPPPRRR